MNEYRSMLGIKSGKVLELKSGESSLAVCPDMGGRVFAEIGGLSVHRIDLDTVANPTKPFNMFGGNTLWPAPEGGKFGFNYKGDEWYVQPAINFQPFETVSADNKTVMIRKTAVLKNRLGVEVETVMKRCVEISDPAGILTGRATAASMAYTSVDTFEVMNELTTEYALIGAWSLEQFDTSPETVSFCAVADPESAINFDYYEHPGERIRYFEKGFTFRTDGGFASQIGIKKDAGAAFIGFYDLSKRLVCIRENLTPKAGLYFNIADNEQEMGPFSASDEYSIFNSDESMKLFELETIAPAHVKKGLLTGSELTSRTTFAIFDERGDVENLVRDLLGER